MYNDPNQTRYEKIKMLVKKNMMNGIKTEYTLQKKD